MKIIKVFMLLLVILVVVLGLAFFPQIKTEVEKFIYPIKFEEIVEQESADYNLDPYLVYAVIETESGFKPKAESHAGAKGLMQMTDETFLWMQEMLGEKDTYTADKLFDPEISIKYGCALLRRLIDYFGNTETALSAYNAGIGNVSSWLSNTEHSDDGTTLKSIPFPETKNYVKKVNHAYEKYTALYGN